MRILVTGGTGFLGRHITGALVAAEHDVSVLSRHVPGSSVDRNPANRPGVQGDVTQSATLNGKLHGFEVVVGAVQFPNHPVERPRKGLTYDHYDRQGTENLLAEAARAGVRRFVYVSGAGADPSSPTSWYRAKGKAEAAVRSSGLEFSILRPSWAYGRGDRALNRIAAIARFSPVVPRIGVRPQRIQPVAADDIALGVRRMVELDDARGQTFEIGGPDVMTMDEVIRTLLRVMGKRRFVLPVPAPVMKIASAPLTLLPNPPLSPRAVDFATQDGLVDTSLLRSLLGIEPVPLAEGLRRYL